MQMWPEMGIEFTVFTAPFPMHQGSKLRNWIARPILNQILWSKFSLKAVNSSFQTSPRAVNSSFQMSPRTSKCGQKWVYNSQCSLHTSLCIKAQNSEIEVQDQYSTKFYGLNSPLKQLIPAFRRAQEHPNVARNGCIDCIVFTLCFPN